MKLKNKIILGVFSAVAITAIPASIALTAVSCGSGNIDGDDSAQTPDTPVDPSPAPQPEPSPGPTPPTPDPVEPPAPAPGPAPTPTPTPSPEASVELKNEQIENINKIINDELGKLTSDNGTHIENEIKTLVNTALASTGITIDSVVLTPANALEADEFVSYNVALNFSSEKTVTLQSSTTLKVEGKQILTVAPIQTTVKNPQHSLVISEDQISAISTILNTEVAKLNGSNESDIQTTIQTQVNEQLKSLGVTVSSVAFTPKTASASDKFISYDVTLNIGATPIVSLASETTLKKVNNSLVTVNPIVSANKNTGYTITIDDGKITAINKILNDEVAKLNSGNTSDIQNEIQNQVNTALTETGITVSSVDLTPVSASASDKFISYNVALNVASGIQFTLASETILTKSENKITTVNPIASTIKNDSYTVTISDDQINAINTILTDQVATLNKTNEADVQTAIKTQVNEKLSSLGVVVDSVTLTAKDADASAEFISYDVTLNIGSEPNVTLASTTVLNKVGNAISTVNALVSLVPNSKYVVTVSAEQITSIMGIFDEQLKKLTDSNESDITSAIKTAVTPILEPSKIVLNSVTLSKQPVSDASEFLTYKVSLDVTSDYTISLANSDSIELSGNSLVTVNPITTTIKNPTYTVNLDEAKISAVNDILNAQVKLFDGTNEATITDAIKNQVNAQLNSLGINVSSVTLDAQPASSTDEKLSYNVTLNIGADPEVTLANETTLKKVNNSLVTVTPILSINKNPDYTITLDNTKINEINTILNDQVKTLSTSNAQDIKDTILSQVNEKLTGTQITVDSVDLNEVTPTETDNFVSYNVVLNVTSANKFVLENDTVLTSTQTQISTVNPIVTTIQNTNYTITIDDAKITAINNILTTKVAKLTADNAATIQEDIKNQVNTELSSLGVSVDSVAFKAKETPDSNKFILNTVSLTFASYPNIKLASTSVFTQSSNVVTTVEGLTTSIPNAQYTTEVSADSITAIMSVFNDQIAKLTEANTDQIKNDIKTAVTPILAKSDIVLNDVTLQRQAVVGNAQFIPYKVTLQVSSSYIIGLANTTSITKSGNDLVTVNTIDSAIKNPSYTATLDTSKIDAINEIVKTQLAAYNGSNDEAIKNNIKTQVNEQLQGAGASVTDVVLTQKSATYTDEYYSYNVVLNITKENNLALASNSLLNLVGNQIQVLTPMVSTNENPTSLPVGLLVEANNLNYMVVDDNGSRALELKGAINSSVSIDASHLADSQGKVQVSRGGTNYNLPVVSIGDKAFYSNNNISGDLLIPSTVKTIKSYAFYGCRYLTKDLVIPNSVTTIGSSCFSSAGFRGTLTLSNSLTSIGSDAFRTVKLTGQLTLPNTITTIGSSAFYWCSFSGQLVIPSSVRTLGTGVFRGCSGFTSLVIQPGITNIGAEAFYECTGMSGTLTIPNTVTIIQRHAFWGDRSFTGLVIPSSVMTIGEWAFEECTSLPTMTLTKPAGANWSSDAFASTKVTVQG